MSSRSSLGGDSQANGQVLYLKDWHCAAEYPNYQGYSTPSYFGDDWLNRYYDRVGTSNKARPDIHDVGCIPFIKVYQGKNILFLFSLFSILGLRAVFLSPES